MNNNIFLSIIVLSYNTRDLLKKCIESVIRGTGKIGKVELIVVDNNSTDGSVEMIKSVISGQLSVTRKNIPITATRSPITIKLIENKENLGFAKGNNIGLKQAKGEYILFLNSDTEVFPDSLQKAILFLENHPKAGVLTPKTLFPSGKIDTDCHRGYPTPWASLTYFFGLEKLFPKSKLFGQYHKFYLGLDNDHQIDAGAGAFMLIKNSILKKVGNWDEDYFFYGEDLDFFYRIKKAGFEIWYYSEPLLIHHKGASSGLRKETKNITRNSKENKIKVAKASIKAMEIFYKKFYSNSYPKLLTFIVLFAIKLKGFFRIIKYSILS